MPFKDPDAQRAYLLSYYQKNKHRIRAKTMAWKRAHPERVREYERNRKKTNPQRARRKWLLRKYGMSQAQYDAILVAQGGACAICKTTENNKNKHGQILALEIDHCHETGKVRGILCGACNRAIGLLKNDAMHARAAAEYLTRARSP